MNITIENGKNFVPIIELHEWDKNPRSITPKDFERLKFQIGKFGQYKPLLATPEGEVLGGNMRLKAFRELGIDKVWVSIVEPKDENEKMEITLSDNDRAGYYDVEMMANIMPNFQIEWDKYAVDLAMPDDLGELIAKYPENPAPETAPGIIISYSLIFDNTDQQGAWFDFIKDLKDKYPDDTVAEALRKFIKDKYFNVQN